MTFRAMTEHAKNNRKPVYLPYSGATLLTIPLLNKDCAFSRSERIEFGILGLLPQSYETLEQQVERAYQQYLSFDEAINQHIYLRAIQDSNETLFYGLVREHIEEMMPIIYTPTVGEACERFSEIYRRARGLFIAFPDRYDIDKILSNVAKNDIKVIVVTDGSRILGLGDQGVGGMGIPIGKLSLYTACGGISPENTLPIMLDVGTNNEELLDDPLYLGWHQKRIDQVAYDEFLDLFIKAVKRRWPEVLLQFEDFNQTNALPLLKRYRDEICCFNDDIQGTAVVTVGTLLSACRIKNVRLSEQKVVFAGAGSAGCGIAEQIVMQMCAEGVSELQARSQVFMIDRHGLLVSNMKTLLDFQFSLSKDPNEIQSWEYSSDYPSLYETIRYVKPTVLVGVSGQTGLFTEAIINMLMLGCEQPVILPLSNPSKQIEATPEQLISWSKGRALIATGSPFKPVTYEGQTYNIPQCNNSYIFPAFGLAVVAAKIQHISDEMLVAASEVLATASSSVGNQEEVLLPNLADIGELSKEIAFAVGKVAQEQGLAAKMSNEALRTAIELEFWVPKYREYKPASPH